MAHSRGPVERLVSAGGVVYHKSGNHMHVVLCGQLNPLKWALPKGTQEPSETMEQTAIREVREETGLDVQIVGALGSIDYWFMRTQDRVRCHKTVHFYLMISTGGSMDKHDPEFDVVKWFPLADALRNMTYAGEAHVVDKAWEFAYQRDGQNG